MNLKEQLMADLKVAMKAKDVETRTTIRSLQAAVKQVEIDKSVTLDDEAILQVIQKQAKQRRESISEFEKGGRPDLAEPEKVELAIIEKYLPTMMTEDEIRAIAEKVIADFGEVDPRSRGLIMGKMMPLVKGKADGGLVNKVVQSLLS